MTLIVGADVGGTSSKAAILNEDLEIIGFAKTAGGNVNSSTGDPLGNIFTAIETAVGGRNSEVAAGHLGIAGAGAARLPSIQAECTQRWEALGMDPRGLTVTSDIDIAYAAGGNGGTGLLLLSGTGAVAASFRNYALVARCDGMGWLLGDIGSATWIGLQVLKAVAAALDHRGPSTAMTEATLVVAAREAGVDEQSQQSLPDLRQRLIASAYKLRPAQYGTLAVIAEEYARKGDPVAGEIMNNACIGLVRSGLTALAESIDGENLAAGTDSESSAQDTDADSPAGDTGGESSAQDTGVEEPSKTIEDKELSIVLTGALLARGGPLNEPVRQMLRAELPHLDSDAISDDIPPIVGSLRLAARTAGWHTTSQEIADALAQAKITF